ncbi:S1C family serine protease [Rubritalea spongiae]|uniref:S1C family serine protease n=1 Tax=Rubritalea spongiae TaxID=430797 RepID=A0ABW5E1H9_9BACT
MKTILSITSVAAVALSGTSFAIERLTPIKEPKGKPAPLVTKAESEQKAWLGVAGQPVDEALGAQLGINHGITIELVSPDGSAAKSGIKKYDIITQIGDEPIKDMTDLRQAMQSAKVDEMLDVEVFTGGKKELKRVKLDARPAHLPSVSAAEEPVLPPSASEQNTLPQAFQHLPANDRLRIEDMMQQQMKQMQEHFSQMGAQFEDLQQLHHQHMQVDPNNMRMKGHSNYNGTFTMMDNEGSIRLTLNDKEGKQVEVKDRLGKVLYAGPYETEKDKEAVPADIRSRIEALGMGQQAQGGGLRFKFGR